MAVSDVTNAATMVFPINPSAGAVQAAQSKELEIREVVRDQARTLEQSCEKGAIRDTLLAASWHRTNLWLGISSAVTAALAAFAVGKGDAFMKVVPHGHEFAAIFALISAILTSALTFLAPSERAGAYHHFSNKLRALRDRARSFVEIDCARSNKDAGLCDKFERMVREKSEIDSSHPIVPNWAYDRAYAEMKKKFANKQSLRQEREAGAIELPTGQAPRPPEQAWDADRPSAAR